MPTSMQAGDVLADRYRLDDLLAENGTGRFWRAHDLVLHRAVSVHLLPADDDRAPAVLEAARGAGPVIDRRLLRVLDAEAADGRCYVVNEWGQGDSLDILVAREGPLPPRRAAWLVGEVADTLAEAHAAGLAHGHLVPENVLIDQHGQVRIIGFGVDAALRGLRAGPGERRRDRPRRPALLRPHRQVGRRVRVRRPARARGARRGAPAPPGARRHPADARRAVRPGPQPPARPGRRLGIHRQRDPRPPPRVPRRPHRHAGPGGGPARGRRARADGVPHRDRAGRPGRRHPGRRPSPEPTPSPSRVAPSPRRRSRSPRPRRSTCPPRPACPSSTTTTRSTGCARVPSGPSPRRRWRRSRRSRSSPPTRRTASPYAARVPGAAPRRPTPTTGRGRPPRTRRGAPPRTPSPTRRSARSAATPARGARARGRRTGGATGQDDTGDQVPGRSWIRLAMIVGICVLVMVAAVAAYQLGLPATTDSGRRADHLRLAEPDRGRAHALHRAWSPTTSTRRAPTAREENSTSVPNVVDGDAATTRGAPRPTSRTSAPPASRPGSASSSTSAPPRAYARSW